MPFPFFKKKQKDAPAMSAEELALIVEACEKASKGDFEARILGLNVEGEIGRLARSINYLMDVADAYVRESAAAMENCSHERFHRPIMLRGMHGAFRKSAVTINTAGRKMRENSEQLAYVATLANENAESVSSVAAACQQLSATSGEISKQTEEFTRTSHKTAETVKSVGDQAKQLHQAAESISDVVALISEITRKTNLLALNATIEAARAGEAGASFAVVATEVKNLSNSIAGATQKINKQVEEMQMTVKGFVEMIQGVSSTVRQFSENSDIISKSVSEQVSATTDIAQNLSHISANTALVSERIAKR